MKISKKRLVKLIRETAREMLTETVEFRTTPEEKAAVWEEILKLVPEYELQDVAWSDEGVTVEMIGSTSDGGSEWVVIAKPLGCKPSGWTVYDYPDSGYDAMNIGVKAAEREFFGDKDRGDANW
jgi:hypothetical protein